MTILYNSKILMYDFIYNELKKQYGSRCKLLYTDTDSLLLEIETDDVYKDIETNKNLYDTSDYPKEHPLHSNTNKKVLGKMKGECAGTPIAECVCLRPVSAYLKTLLPRGSLSCGRKRRSAWWTLLGVGTPNFGRGIHLGVGTNICQSACLISHLFVVSSGTLAASANSSSPRGRNIFASLASIAIRRSKKFKGIGRLRNPEQEPRLLQT